MTFVSLSIYTFLSLCLGFSHFLFFNGHLLHWKIFFGGHFPWPDKSCWRVGDDSFCCVDISSDAQYAVSLRIHSFLSQNLHLFLCLNGRLFQADLPIQRTHFQRDSCAFLEQLGSFSYTILYYSLCLSFFLYFHSLFNFFPPSKFLLLFCFYLFFSPYLSLSFNL